MLQFTSFWKFLEVPVYQVSYLNKCSIWPPFCCTTHSRRRRHSLMLLSMNACYSCCQALTIACLRRHLECVVEQDGGHVIVKKLTFAISSRDEFLWMFVFRWGKLQVVALLNSSCESWQYCVNTEMEGMTSKTTTISISSSSRSCSSTLVDKLLRPALIFCPINH